jgi:alpha-galactosidase
MNAKDKVVLIGAGSAMFTRGLLADILLRNWDVELALVDTDPEALAVAEGLARKMVAACRAPVRVIAATERRDVLKDASAVICTIGVGGRRAWEQDVFVPRRHGVFQPVGDSVMPGGASRALRMIPPMVAIARDVMELAPRALFFNYGNPMSAVCRGVRKATGAPMVGLCHGVFDVGRQLAVTLGVSPERLAYTAVGMNHLTWFVELRVDGANTMPRLREVARERLSQIDLSQAGKRFAEDGSAERCKQFEAVGDVFTWQLTDLFGAFPAVMDRHITEFFPHLFARRGGYYGRTLGVDAYSFEGTIAYGEKIFGEMRETALSKDPLPADYFDHVSGEHEQVTEIIDCIRRDEGKVFSANVPNAGQVPNLPEDAVVECPCIMTAAGPRPLQQPPLSAGLAATLASRFQWVETVVDAALECSREKFVQALFLDGSVDSVAAARKLADDLLAAQAPHLPTGFRSSAGGV